ncbi:MAG: hypothetical protein P8L85_13195 [Rubripirellula sp.]|nr:hypothetical protein [Rubripirellula sp.]
MVVNASYIRCFGPLVWLFLAATLLADSVSLGLVSTRPGVAGFVVDVAVETVGGNGYHPIHLTFRPRGKQFVRDRRLSVRITPRNEYRTNLDFDFQVDIVVPESSTSYRTTLLVPHYYAWNRISVSVSEGGSPVTDVIKFPQLSLRTRDASPAQSVGIVLAADEKVQDAAWKKFPDARALITVLGDGPILEEQTKIPARLSHLKSLAFAKRVQPAFVQFRVLEEKQLAEHWLAHSQLDIILIAAPILKRVQTEQPAAFAAIQKWVASGGNLWVYANDLAPFDWVTADSLQIPQASLVPSDKALRYQLDLKSLNDTSRLMLNGAVHKESMFYQGEAKFKSRGIVYEVLVNAKHPLAKIEKPAEVTNRLRIAGYGLGTVATIADEDPFPGSFQFWKTLIAMHVPEQLSWEDRMGVDVPAGNDDYWMWLIPSVGQPPVNMFVFLNTVFALVVGPLCYFYFRRRQRLYLLYFFAPLLGLLVTVSLFLYALISDGVQTQVRCRQLTWVDPASGYQVQQNRQTYFAATGRKEGIRLSDKVAVYPVYHSPTYQAGYYGQTRSSESSIVQSGDDRIHREDFLPSRRQVQYLTLAVNEETGAVRFSSQDSFVTNGLDLNFEKLLIRDHSGKFWLVSDLAAGDSKVMQASDQSVLARFLGSSARPQLSEVPVLQQRYTGFLSEGSGSQVSLLESRLDQWLTRMPTGTFLGLSGVDLERVGVDDVYITDSSHVIMGRLP